MSRNWLSLFDFLMVFTNYCLETSNPSDILVHKLSVHIDENDSSQPLQVSHSPAIQGQENFKVAQAIRVSNIILDAKAFDTFDLIRWLWCVSRGEMCIQYRNYKWWYRMSMALVQFIFWYWGLPWLLCGLRCYHWLQAVVLAVTKKEISNSNSFGT